MGMDYVYETENGDKIVIEYANKLLPKIDLSKLNGKELENACALMFFNLGWTVEKAQEISMEQGSFKPDMVLAHNGKKYGYVEIITATDMNDIAQKKAAIKAIVDKCKPKLFVLTNGIVFDVFFDGEYVGTQSTPPSLDTIMTTARLKAYYNAIKKMTGEGTQND